MLSRRSLSVMMLLIVSINFYFFSRLTIDDAFISWRYGKNLVNHGIWNYNPAHFDMTLAYTNPLYSILSIIPSFFNIDVVLFFKLFSIFLLLGFFFSVFYERNRNEYLLILLLPSTILHLFSGLETFLFGILIFLQFRSIYERKFRLAYILTIVLFLVRPEAWLFALIVPLYVLVQDLEDLRELRKMELKEIKSLRFKPAFKSFLILSVFLAAMFLFNKIHFGDFLPNTFYAKKGAVLNRNFILKTLIVLSPLGYVLYRTRSTLILFYLLFMFVVGFKYSTSLLSMNYSERFLYHIFLPTFLISTYFLAKDALGDINKLSDLTRIKYIVLGIPLLFYLSVSLKGSIKMNFYYNRLLNAHVSLGKTLYESKEKYNINSITIGDAGATPYLSDLLTLDKIGLGSSKVIKSNGVNEEILNAYEPNLLIMRADTNGIRLNSQSQGLIVNWAKSRNFIYTYDIWFEPNYILKVLTKSEMLELEHLSLTSNKLNNVSNKRIIYEGFVVPPIKFWHE